MHEQSVRPSKRRLYRRHRAAAMAEVGVDRCRCSSASFAGLRRRLRAIAGAAIAVGVAIAVSACASAEGSGGDRPFPRLGDVPPVPQSSAPQQRRDLIEALTSDRKEALRAAAPPRTSAGASADAERGAPDLTPALTKGDASNGT
jgi:hypothetical protein